MKLYAFKDPSGNWYAGRSPTDRVKETKSFAEAWLFTEETVQDADECFQMGFDRYSMELSEPVLDIAHDDPDRPRPVKKMKLS